MATCTLLTAKMSTVQPHGGRRREQEQSPSFPFFESVPVADAAYVFSVKCKLLRMTTRANRVCFPSKFTSTFLSKGSITTTENGVEQCEHSKLLGQD